MNSPSTGGKDPKQKTLPEIVQSLIKQNGAELLHERLAHPSVIEATEAIAKELMGIIGEDEEVDTLEGHNAPSWDEMRRQAAQIARNQLKATQRARLTAFIGHKEK